MLKCWHIHVNKICYRMYLPIYLAGGNEHILIFWRWQNCVLFWFFLLFLMPLMVEFVHRYSRVSTAFIIPQKISIFLCLPLRFPHSSFEPPQWESQDTCLQKPFCGGFSFLCRHRAESSCFATDFFVFVYQVLCELVLESIIM